MGGVRMRLMLCINGSRGAVRSDGSRHRSIPVALGLLLQSGANVKTVSERLGHASTAFTMDVYAASVPALEEETAAKVAALLD